MCGEFGILILRFYFSKQEFSCLLSTVCCLYKLPYETVSCYLRECRLASVMGDRGECILVFSSFCSSVFILCFLSWPLTEDENWWGSHTIMFLTKKWIRRENKVKGLLTTQSASAFWDGLYKWVQVGQGLLLNWVKVKVLALVPLMCWLDSSFLKTHEGSSIGLVSNEVTRFKHLKITVNIFETFFLLFNVKLANWAKINWFWSLTWFGIVSRKRLTDKLFFLLEK